MGTSRANVAFMFGSGNAVALRCEQDNALVMPRNRKVRAVTVDSVPLEIEV